MKRVATGKLLRAILIAIVLVVGLVSGISHKSSRVDAKSCDEALTDYFNADNTYYMARLSYFNGIPTTCQEDCQNSQNQTQCIENCRTNRRTALGNAEITLFDLAGDTCTPVTIDECAQARSMADDCLAQYNPNNYSDPEEAMAVSSEYWACREASKVDSCE